MSKLQELNSTPAAPNLPIKPAKDLPTGLSGEFNGVTGYLSTPPLEAPPKNWDALVKQAGFDPTEVEVHGEVRTSFWEVPYRDESGELDTKLLHSYRVHLRKRFDLPDLDFLKRDLKTKRQAMAKEPDTDQAFVVALGDLQIGKDSLEEADKVCQRFMELTDQAAKNYKATSKGKPVYLIHLGDCLTPDTEIVTHKGIVRIGDIVCKTVMVKDGNGQWVSTEIKPYGIKPITLITWKSESPTTWIKSVKASNGHEWILTDGSRVKSSDLEPGMTAVKSTTSQHTWTVESVEPAGESETFCCVVPTTHSFHLADGLITSNCIEGHVSQNGDNSWRTPLTTTEQVRIYSRLIAYQAKVFAPIAPHVTFVGIPGNHDEAARPTKKYSDSWAIQAMVWFNDAKEFNNANGAYDHVNVIVPNDDELTVTLDICGTIVACAHGHQFRGKNGWRTWWSNQSHHRHDPGSADVLLAGHLHHLVVVEEGTAPGHPAKLFLQVPSLESESRWFRHTNGAGGKPGLVTLTVGGGQWGNLQVLNPSI